MDRRRLDLSFYDLPKTTRRSQRFASWQPPCVTSVIPSFSALTLVRGNLTGFRGPYKESTVAFTLSLESNSLAAD